MTLTLNDRLNGQHSIPVHTTNCGSIIPVKISHNISCKVKACLWRARSSSAMKFAAPGPVRGLEIFSVRCFHRSPWSLGGPNGERESLDGKSFSDEVEEGVGTERGPVFATPI